MGVPKMRRNPPSTIYRYLDLPSKQFQTHNTPRHNATPPSLAQAVHPLSHNTTPTKPQTNIPLSPCSSTIGKAQSSRPQRHRNNLIHNIGYHDNRTDRPRTTNTSSKNGLKTNSRSSNCLFTTHMQISSQFRKPSSPLKSKHPKYITS